MRLIDSMISYFVPDVLITDPEWKEKWSQLQKENFLRYVGFFFFVIAIGYIANYFLFDVPMGLEPADFWLTFRVLMAAMAAVCTAFYISPWTRTRFYKVPAMLGCFTMCYTQAYVTIWFSQDAWLFFYFFVMGCTLILSLNVIWSIAYASSLCILGAPILEESGITPEYTVSSTIVVIGFVAIMRRSALSDVRNFLLSEQNLAQQKRIAELSNEYAGRVQSFIPRVIADRMSNYIEDGMSVVEASIEALKARKKPIACLFTDIRGFTQDSKELDDFIAKSVMPEVTACSNAIEDLSGIPRKVGDLIFAYFDDDSMHLNILRAIRAGVQVARLNEAMNLSASEKRINRYILISSGEAMVGNFGGLDSSIEITALGTPVNFLSRVDDITKSPAIADRLDSGDLILSSEVKEFVDELDIDIHCEHIDLDYAKIEIRDFPEVRALYKLAPTHELEELLDEVLMEVIR